MADHGGQGAAAECHDEEHGEMMTYDLGWHIAAVFVVLGVALAGTMIPVAGRVGRWRLHEYVFALLKNFGSGVILATGFVHMFPPANVALSHACLPDHWKAYSAWAGLFALIAALFVQLVQTAAITHFSRRHHHHHHHTHSHDISGAALEDGRCANHCHSTDQPTTRPTVASDDTMHHHHTNDNNNDNNDMNNDMNKDSDNNDNDDLIRTDSDHTQATVSTATAQGDDAPKRYSQESIQADFQNVLRRPVELGALTTATNIHQDGCCDVQHAILAAGGHSHRQITAYILEIGIAMHSIIIGIAIGVATGSEFFSLLIAISFHQFFEGVALSSTALDAGFASLVTPLTMAVVYTMTTPLGIAIGIAISSVYKAGSPAALLTQGIFDAISAGILIYDALVNLITANITHNATFAGMSLAKKAGIFMALWVGAGAMAFLGRWA